MLLSFAQFERELTSERIRDKVAASKAKGMWMGGTPPLGYRSANRALEVIPEEADLVRRIFGRYVELQSLTALAAELGGLQSASFGLSRLATNRPGVRQGSAPDRRPPTTSATATGFLRWLVSAHNRSDQATRNGRRAVRRQRLSVHWCSAKGHWAKLGWRKWPADRRARAGSALQRRVCLELKKA
jgi:hypothetical protein